jgi:hypothetical protein
LPAGRCRQVKNLLPLIAQVPCKRGSPVRERPYAGSRRVRKCQWSTARADRRADHPLDGRGGGQHPARGTGIPGGRCGSQWPRAGRFPCAVACGEGARRRAGGGRDGPSSGRGPGAGQGSIVATGPQPGSAAGERRAFFAEWWDARAAVFYAVPCAVLCAGQGVTDGLCSGGPRAPGSD